MVSAVHVFFSPRWHLAGKVGARREFLVSENRILSPWGVLARKFFDFCLAMAGNLLIWAHFAKENVHFGKDLNILAWRDLARQGQIMMN